MHVTMELVTEVQKYIHRRQADLNKVCRDEFNMNRTWGLEVIELKNMKDCMLYEIYNNTNFH